MERVLKSMWYLLESNTGGLGDKISLDLTHMYREVTKASDTIENFLSLPVLETETKSADKSIALRIRGNLLYKIKNYTEALQCYNKALAYAPNNSLEVTLAYGNISAVLVNIGAYRDCQMNIKAALKLDCPDSLRIKLKKRMTEVDKHITEELFRDMMISDDGMQNFCKFGVKRNSEIPCASEDVCVEGGKVVAAREIKSGTMVAMERAFVSVQDEPDKCTSCYNCHRICLFLIPCEGCCKALFCSKECREKCLEEYHRIECHVATHMGVLYLKNVNQLAVRAAIKMSLKLSWEELSMVSLQMGQKRVETSSVNEAFDCNNPRSMVCYNDQIDVSVEEMAAASVVCAEVMTCLCRVPGYLPEGNEERENAIDALSRIMLQLNTTFLRQITIICSTFDYKDESYRWPAQRNTGWFSFTSKLAHSCEPNLLVVGFNDHVGSVALQRIKKGQPLTISYTGHFYDMTLLAYPKNTRIRQKRIYNDIQYKCECRVCLLEWDSRSNVPGTMTTRQEEALHRYKRAMVGGSFERRMAAIGATLDELTGYLNTTQHWNVYEALKEMLRICQCATDSNKAYGFMPHYTRMI